MPDANRLAVSTTSDVINLMNLGHKNRAVSSTAMNDRSSRSHRYNFVLPGFDFYLDIIIFNYPIPNYLKCMFSAA